ncbi:EscD/YscD/HrpQ family type III secretion system inner membrane ring protein [Pigmentiphaga aceris]|uniref:EscD/YscD/HrpQ family type III secretion system inner membrane ring protein n=1 Tax=Pigmentiphaga aceris TaxID=1940612 RepID=A0A5C0B2Y9_9BURK|nr:type III secretion system inner membrane ring subunit SctD [Pigmentiphaga aceris]QEI08274.1 EscD/YscD/HrpQ family type III secretion system inner membrane ring protein [Pigmentiphaga aceris]
MSARHEFRVLSGVHADARCAIEADARVGSDAAGDIVLSDAGVPRSAHLRVSGEKWSLAANDADAAPDLSLSQPVQLGDVWVTVSRPDDPWPVVPVAVSATASAAVAAGIMGTEQANETSAPQTEAPSPATPQDLAGKPVDPAILAATGTATEAATPPPRRRGRLLVPLALLLMVLAIAVALGVALLPNQPQAKVATVDPRAAALEQSVAAIEKALDSLGMRPALQVSRGAGGVVTVTGWVRDRAEQDRVAGALARIWPMPAMRVNNREEVADSAQALLRPYSYRYAASMGADGSLAVSGVASDAAQRERALTMLRSQLPGINVDGMRIVLAQQVSDTLYAQLENAGLTQVRLMWQTDRLEASTEGLTPVQLARLREMIERFNPRFMNIVALPALPPQAAAVVAAAAAPPVATTVPFRIQSVVGGPQPFLVLGDGSKLVPGGTYKRYRLASIEAGRIVFDQPHAAVVAR